MDLLDNIATELMFEFHLYIVRDELFGAKYTDLNDWKRNKTDSTSAHSNKPGHDLSTLNVNTSKTTKIYYMINGVVNSF